MYLINLCFLKCLWFSPGQNARLLVSGTNHNATSIMIWPHCALVALEKRERVQSWWLGIFPKARGWVEKKWSYLRPKKEGGHTDQNSKQLFRNSWVKFELALLFGKIFSFIIFFLHSINPPSIKAMTYEIRFWWYLHYCSRNFELRKFKCLSH